MGWKAPSQNSRKKRAERAAMGVPALKPPSLNERPLEPVAELVVFGAIYSTQISGAGLKVERLHKELLKWQAKARGLLDAPTVEGLKRSLRYYRKMNLCMGYSGSVKNPIALTSLGVERLAYLRRTLSPLVTGL
jgi:hypothetical protein